MRSEREPTSPARTATAIAAVVTVTDVDAPVATTRAEGGSAGRDSTPHMDRNGRGCSTHGTDHSEEMTTDTDNDDDDDETATRTVFDTECRVSTGGHRGDAVDGRVIVGRGQVVVATDERGETIPVERVFDVSATAAGTDADRVSLGYESTGGRRVVRIRPGPETAVRLRRAIFTAVLDETWATVRRRGAGGDASDDRRTRRGRLVVGDERLRVVRDGTLVQSFGAVERVTQSDTPTQVRVSVRRCGASETYELGLPSPRLGNVVTRYLRTVCITGTGGLDGTRRVLLVDDDVGFAELASEFLAHEHDAIEVETATDAAAGIERLRRSPPVDCVVSDYRMPPTDGLSFLRAVRDLDPDVPFVLFTGQGDEDVAAEAIRAGVTDYVRKRATAAQFAFLGDRISRAMSADER